MSLRTHYTQQDPGSFDDPRCTHCVDGDCVDCVGCACGCRRPQQVGERLPRWSTHVVTFVEGSKHYLIPCSSRENAEDVRAQEENYHRPGRMGICEVDPSPLADYGYERDHDLSEDAYANRLWERMQ